MPVQGAHVYDAISAGTYHTCGLLSTGQIECWGDDSEGQLGDGLYGNNVYSTTPVLAASGRAYAAVIAGDMHTCGLTHAGTLECWVSS